MNTDLTILIPTWDRPQEVNQRLKELNDLWKGEIPIKIQVNPGKFSSKDIDKTLYQGPIEIAENPFNIGLYGNVVCGLHGITTRWLWILGDDDSVKPEAKSLVEQAILLSEKEGIDFILFNQWDCENNNSHVVCNDLETYTQATAFTNSLFISASIWRTSFFNRSLLIFIEYSYSLSSQVSMQLVALAEKTAKFLVSNQQLVMVDYAHRWDRISYLTRVFFILKHPSLWEKREIINAFMWPQCKWALTSAAHEQMRTGQASFGQWMQAAFQVSIHQLLCSRPTTALQRISSIWSILLEVYPPPQLTRKILSIVKQTLIGRRTLQPTGLQRSVGLPKRG